MRRLNALVITIALALGNLVAAPSFAASKIYGFTAEIWADNWFSLYVNGKKVGEDSVPFATERSFNSEKISFKATYPLTIGIVARDYVENVSGLEYITKPNQQIGDGGLIAQFRESESGRIIGFTDKSWKVFVLNKAPLNAECVKSANPLKDCKTLVTKTPTSWSSSTFKDSSWKSATTYSPSEVGVKDGYFDFSWTPESSLIWSSDLKIDNTVLMRNKFSMPKAVSENSVFKLSSPEFANGGKLPSRYTCDGVGESPALTLSGVPSHAKSLALLMDTVPGPLRPGEVDIGNHFYLIIYDIPTNTTVIPAGARDVGVLGQNFQGKNLGYTPPCSQGKGVKDYTFTAFALTEKLNLQPTQVTQTTLLAAMEGKVIAKSTLVAQYQRP